MKIFKTLSLCLLFSTYITFSWIMLTASMNNWLVTLDFNSVGEGVWEVILLLIGWGFMLFWFLFERNK